MQDKNRHINQLEMKAVMLTVRHFLPQLRGHTVLFRSDNTTVVQCINKQGSTKYVQMCYQTSDLWHLALENNITLKASHVAGSRNILADNLSRVKISADRMVSEGLCDSQTVLDLGPSFNRPVCIRNKSQDCSLLHMDSQSIGLSDRRIVNCM